MVAYVALYPLSTARPIFLFLLKKKLRTHIARQNHEIKIQIGSIILILSGCFYILNISSLLPFLILMINTEKDT